MNDTARKLSVSSFASEFHLTGEELETEYKLARARWRRARPFRYLLQRAAGVFLMLLAVAWIPMLDGDATHLFIFTPLATYALFSRVYIFCDDFQLMDRIMDPMRYR